MTTTEMHFVLEALLKKYKFRTYEQLIAKLEKDRAVYSELINYALVKAEANQEITQEESIDKLHKISKQELNELLENIST